MLISFRMKHSDVYCRMKCNKKRECGHVCQQECSKPCKCACDKENPVWMPPPPVIEGVDGKPVAFSVTQSPTLTLQPAPRSPAQRQNRGGRPPARNTRLPPPPPPRSPHPPSPSSPNAYQEFAAGGHVAHDARLNQIARDNAVQRHQQMLDQRMEEALFGGGAEEPRSPVVETGMNGGRVRRVEVWRPAEAAERETEPSLLD